MSKNDGGPAFPTDDYPTEKLHGGMTLRDYFAGQCLAGRMARQSQYKSWEDVAKDAYECANAMLKERDNG